MDNRRTIIFMNERVRDAHPDGPVIVAQSGGRRRVANTFELEVDGKVIGAVKFRPRGLRAVKTHVVHAWVELTNEVTVR